MREDRAAKHAISLMILAASALFIQTSCPAPRDLPLLAQFDFEKGNADGWQPKDPGHWRVVNKDGSSIYELTAPGEAGKVRAPTSWSLVAGRDVSSFVFTGRLRCSTDPANTKRDMCVIFHYQDPAHFYYVHFAGSSDDVHNVIALVDGADRKKINAEPAGGSVFRLIDRNWHDFKVTCDGRMGEIKAYLDDMNAPILTALDATLRRGLVGVGSFDDTGAFDDIRMWGKR